MDCNKLFSGEPIDSSPELWQTKKCCYGRPALLDVVFQQTVAWDNLPNVLIVLVEPLLTLLFVVIVSIAEMVPDQIVMLAPSPAVNGVCIAQELP